MSYLEVFAARENGDVTKYGKAHNSHGGAYHIWETLRDKYQVVNANLYDGFKPVWDSIGAMEEQDQWVLASTFDYILFPKEHLSTLIKHLGDFTERYPTETLFDEINILEQTLQDNEVMGVGFQQTSVAKPLWTVHLPSDDIIDDERPYNVKIDNLHIYITPESLSKLNRKPQSL